MRYSFLLLTALGLSLVACAQRATPQQQKPAARKPRTVSTIPINTAPTDTALVFQRTPCYGTCPAYTATVFRNGQVSYYGDRAVTLLGPHTLSLPPATVAAMLDEARRINFNELAPRYAAYTTDLPAAIITVYQPGQPRHRVFAEENIPAPLQGYINYLKGKLDPLSGTGTDR